MSFSRRALITESFASMDIAFWLTKIIEKLFKILSLKKAEDLS